MVSQSYVLAEISWPVLKRDLVKRWVYNSVPVLLFGHVWHVYSLFRLHFSCLFCKSWWRMELLPVLLVKSRNLKPLLLPQPGSLLARFTWKPGNFLLGKHDGGGSVILFLWLPFLIASYFLNITFYWCSISTQMGFFCVLVGLNLGKKEHLSWQSV